MRLFLNSILRVTQIFKYLFQQQEQSRNWVHTKKSDETILDTLREGDIDLLIATSAIEEGVDVPLCSYVVAFDPIQTGPNSHIP